MRIADECETPGPIKFENEPTYVEDEFRSHAAATEVPILTSQPTKKAVSFLGGESASGRSKGAYGPQGASFAGAVVEHLAAQRAPAQELGLLPFRTGP